MLILCVVAQSCPTLCDPMDCSPPGSFVHGETPGKNLEWVAMPFSQQSSQPRDRTQVFCIAGGFFSIWAPREALVWWLTTLEASYKWNRGRSWGKREMRVVVQWVWSHSCARRECSRDLPYNTVLIATTLYCTWGDWLSCSAGRSHVTCF